VRIKSDERTLLVHRRLRFELGPEGITGLVAGDIEVEAGPFQFDLAVRIEQRAAPSRTTRPAACCWLPMITEHRSGAPGAGSCSATIAGSCSRPWGHRIEVGLTPYEQGPLDSGEQR
jgi:hypothetical protein